VTRIAHHLAAIWFADIVGYTTLSSRDEDEAVRLVNRLQEIAQGTVEGHGGRVVKFVGDAVLASFSSTDEAVRAALEVQEQFTGGGTPGAGGPSLRIGIHVGDVVTSVDGDMYGDGVNVASRVQRLTDPGEVWVSEDVWRQLRQRAGFRFEPRGERELKGLAAPVTVYGVRMEAEVAAGSTAAGARPDASRQHLQSPKPTAARRSIAVLPFANMSRDPDNEYFSDGITETLLMTLTKLGDLKVISRTSVMQYKGTTKSVRQIGEELDVATVLEGSVQRAGERVRITAQLIEARTDAHLWADTYDRNLEDIFAIQSEVAERIATSLKAALTPAEKARLESRPTDSVEAYEWFLKGRYFLAKRTAATLRHAAGWFRKAVEADPEFALAWSGLADACGLLPLYSATPAEEILPEARAAAERALALDPGLGEVHASLGNVAQREWNWREADSEFRRSIELSPGYATAHHWYGLLLRFQRRQAEALKELQLALELDPLSLPVHMALGSLYGYSGQEERALEIYRKAIEMDPSYVIVHNNLAALHLTFGRFEEALAELEIVASLDPARVPADLVAELRSGYEARGARGFWEAQLEGVRSREDVPGRLLDMAQACVQLGRADEAFELLERGVEARDLYVTQIFSERLFHPLRSDPRFDVLLRKMGLA
jgi:adenylate cyclase